MAFDQIARGLIREVKAEPARERFNHINALKRAGLDGDTVAREFRSLIDDCGEEDKAVKLRALEALSRMHGFMQPDEVVRQAPIIQLNIQGDNVRVNAMLAPFAASAAGLTLVGNE